MGCALYRAGKTHIIRGVECEMIVVQVEHLESHLNAGWLTDPKDINTKPEFEDVDTNKTGKLSNDEVRDAAKKAGYEDWKKARIATLKKRLGCD